MAWNDLKWTTCEKCKHKKLCHELPADLTCEEVAHIAEIQPKDGEQE